MPNFTLRLSLYDSKTNDPVYFKQDGKRFGSSSLEERTLKLSTSVKYRVNVTVPSSATPLNRLIIAGADLVPEKESGGDQDTVYSFSWITNGYSKTKSGSRVVVPITFALDGMNVVCKLQAKFYEYGNGQHLTWGQPVSAIELICASDPATSGAAALDTSPLEVKFK